MSSTYKEAPVQELRERISNAGIVARALLDAAKQMLADDEESAAFISLCVTVFCNSPEDAVKAFEQHVQGMTGGGDGNATSGHAR